MSKYDILEADKYPVSSTKHVGIEIEFISSLEEDDIIDLLVKYDLQNNCNLKDDGSLNGERIIKEIMPTFKHDCDDHGWSSMTYVNGQHIYKNCSGCEEEDAWEAKYEPTWNTFELTVLTTETEMKKILNRVKLVMEECKAEVNNSCGLHVHLDMRNRDMKKCVKSLLSKQKEFRKMVDKSRLQNSMCKPLTATLAKRKQQDRYRDINLCAYEKFGTVEIRIHEGCVNTWEIYNWCRYLISIVDNKKASKSYVKKRIIECA